MHQCFKGAVRKSIVLSPLSAFVTKGNFTMKKENTNDMLIKTDLINIQKNMHLKENQGMGKRSFKIAMGKIKPLLKIL